MTDKSIDIGRSLRIATIGMFDGVHLGHRHLLAELKAKASALRAEPVVLTFAHHPASLLRPGRTTGLLTDTSLRGELIHRLCGIAAYEVMEFSRNDFRATAAEFLAGLRCKHGIGALLMGFNNHIGSDHLTAGALKAVLAGTPGLTDFIVSEASPLRAGEYNSTAVRAAVSVADFDCAQRILGHPFTVRGKVVDGKHLGRTIGFPTANVEPLADGQLFPPDGVYAVNAHTGGLTLPAMANIGTRPTIDDGDRRTFEVHIIGFEHDIYGQTIDVDIIRHLRPERRFPDITSLAAQLAEDRADALRILNMRQHQ